MFWPFEFVQTSFGGGFSQQHIDLPHCFMCSVGQERVELFLRWMGEDALIAAVLAEDSERQRLKR